MPLRKIGLVPVLRAENEEQALALASAVAAGGVNVLEVTMTVPGAFRVMRRLAEERPDILIGAGTVLDAETARLCILEGAEFVVSPALKMTTIEMCHRYGVPVLPGRADAHRDPHRVGGRRGRGQGLPGKRAGRGEVPEVDQGAAAPGGAGAHRRRIAGHRGGVSGGRGLRARRGRRPGEPEGHRGGHPETITENARKYLAIVQKFHESQAQDAG